MTDLLGIGTTADVLKVNVHDKDMAVKVFRQKYSRSAKFELDIMRRFRHPNIIHPAPDAVQNEEALC